MFVNTENQFRQHEKEAYIANCVVNKLLSEIRITSIIIHIYIPF